MQRAKRNTLRTENGRENWTNELISLLFENITTLAQLHKFTRAEGTTEETSHNSKGHGAQAPPVSCMAGILIDINKFNLIELN